METQTLPPPSIQPAPHEEAREDRRARTQEVSVSGGLHALDRDYVLVLPEGLRVANNIVGLLFFALFAGLWLVFGALLTFDQSALDTVWQRLLDLPLILQFVVWLLFLPITVGLWIWESDWTLWLRLMLVIVVGVGWTVVMFPRESGNREVAPDATPGWHDVPPEPSQ